MSSLSIRLSDEIERLLDQEAARSSRSRSDVVREAIAEYVARRERERFMEEMVAAANALASDAAARDESTALAEESIEAGNEALDIAEGRNPGASWPEDAGEKWWR